MNLKLLILIWIVTLLVPFSLVTVHSEEFDELDQFEQWADSHGIDLVGVNKNSRDLYYYGFNPEHDTVDWRNIPGVLTVANSLYLVPEDIIKVMDGKTIYFSTKYGRSYAVLGSFPDYDILKGVDRGIILERNYNSHTVIHEIGHIVDYHGIRGMYDDQNHFFEDSSESRESVFKVTVEYRPNTSDIPSGYISAYSTVNDAENFAENFAYYILNNDKFQKRILEDPLLEDEYEFLRIHIFNDTNTQ